ncbi:MAG: carbamate kinase [Acidimicrobiia bacterium]|nr:MAG: carbamate kinase [Acidimicrobiia bacterium]
MRIVAAIGGNALIPRGSEPSAEVQLRNVEEAASALAALAPGNQLVVTHGNGPQVGLLAHQSAAVEGVDPYPLDILGAESDGMIGYLVARELRERLGDREVAALLTMVEVDADDPAFQDPTKPIGVAHPAERLTDLVERFGWTMIGVEGGVRRVVPSPKPKAIPELPTIRLLLEAGAVVVCGGGGGIPVVRTAAGWAGVEAVVDKDLLSALLAAQLGADHLLLLTDVSAVFAHFGTPAAHRLEVLHLDEVEGSAFAAGSMGPKVEAGAWFTRTTGKPSSIGATTDAAAVLAGEAGTRIAK